jgi:hypothetical protein
MVAVRHKVVVTEKSTANTCSTVYTMDQQMYYSDNLLIYSTAPTRFDVCISSSGSLLLCDLLSYITMCIVVTYVRHHQGAFFCVTC